MKKFISLLMALIMMLSCMSMLAYAAETDEGGEKTDENQELSNIALVESALPYASSEKNTLWTPAAALNDGDKSADTWQGWECAYPNIIYGSDTSKGFSGDYCGIKFLNREYYEITKMYVNLGLHAAMGGQNPHYVAQCLVEGVWVTVAEFNDSDTKPLAYENYADAMENDTSFYHIPAEIEIVFDEPVTTNNFRITISEYAKNYPSGDVLIFPYIYEIELTGKLGETPEIELPEGAVISSNIGYGSFPEASTSAEFRYPYRAIDGDIKTDWRPSKRDAGQYLILDFINAKKINKAVVNFGEYTGGSNLPDYPYEIQAFVNGEWIKVAEGTTFDEENLTLIMEHEFDEVETSKLRLYFPGKFTIIPSVYEFEAHMSQEKTYYVENRYDSMQRISASKGNIAIIGNPYASHDFIPYSSIDYINDGRIDKDAYVWFSGVLDMPVYCGVEFNTKQLINKVAVYVHVPDEEGTDIMGIEIQALIDGEFVTLVKAKSYHKLMKYTTVYEFDAVETDNIRILYTSGSGTFANLRELEIYSPNGLVPMFDGLEPMDEVPEVLTEENVNTSEEIISTMPSLEIGKTSVNQPIENTNGINNEKGVLSNGYVPNEWRAIVISSIFIISLIGLAFYLVKRKASK